jgi:hypothetical protein
MVDGLQVGTYQISLLDYLWADDLLDDPLKTVGPLDGRCLVYHGEDGLLFAPYLVCQRVDGLDHGPLGDLVVDDVQGGSYPVYHGARMVVGLHVGPLLIYYALLLLDGLYQVRDDGPYLVYHVVVGLDERCPVLPVQEDVRLQSLLNFPTCHGAFLSYGSDSLRGFQVLLGQRYDVLV